MHIASYFSSKLNFKQNKIKIKKPFSKSMFVWMLVTGSWIKKDEYLMKH